MKPFRKSNGGAIVPRPTGNPEDSDKGGKNVPEGSEIPQEPVKYATPVQRVWAWVGVGYMVILLLLTTYGLAHGAFLRGIGGLMLSPALLGLGATAIVRYRQGAGRGGIAACALVSGLSFALVLFHLIREIPVLISQLRG